MRYRLDKPVRRRGARLLRAWRFSAGFVAVVLIASLAFLHLGVSAQQKILGKIGIKKHPLAVSGNNQTKGANPKSKVKSSKKVTQKKRQATQPATVTIGQNLASGQCRPFNSLNDTLKSSSHPIVRKVWEYQKVCNGDFLSHTMIFTAIPDSAADIGFWAGEIASSLKTFSAYGLQPLVVLEPSKSLNLTTYSQGSHDDVMRQYFSAVKNHGITDAVMGEWVLFPEANIPAWGNTSPSTFSANVTRTAQIMKNVFPGAKATIMLDSKTYPSDDLAYVRGTYSSLIPYVQNIPKGLLDSFGFQGFPWTPPANTIDSASTDATTFLNASMAHEAATYLGIRKVWFNTGTFRSYYAQDPARRVDYSAQQRQAILSSVIVQLRAMQQRGYTVTANIFAEDKSAVAEAVNWSYWPDGQPGLDGHTSVFENFVAGLQASGIQIGIFDTMH